ncbi:transposase [Desulfuromusa kysingii]|uniref:transposase n=1 Tax=Desulfuromusa kysingii TaxID=37625 RepID=UPI0011134F39
MARPLRIENPNAWYHVMDRGRHWEDIFVDQKDHDAFLAILQESTNTSGVQIAAYCLMSNHYHLLVQTPSGFPPFHSCFEERQKLGLVPSNICRSDLKSAVPFRLRHMGVADRTLNGI